MTRIVGIGTYIPGDRRDNRPLCATFDITPDFLREKIGVLERARKADDEETSDMCVAAFRDLAERTGIGAIDVDAVIVVTQNPDGRGLPHTAAAVHAKIGANPRCATFDVSQGCAGFIYGLSIAQGLLAGGSARRVLLMTCDPYSKIVDPADRNTALLFGDGASATLLDDDSGPGWIAENFRFGMLSGERGALEAKPDGFFMDGRGVFNFAAIHVSKEIGSVLADAGLSLDQIDMFALHQGSKYIVDTIVRRMGLPREKVPFEIEHVGNTVSSSIPLLVADRLKDTNINTMLLCGFGVGLSLATCILHRT